MGNKYYTGVYKASDSTIEIQFNYQGKRCRERIQLIPSAANLKLAAHHRAAILYAINNGAFDYQTTFPNSVNLKHFRKTSSASISTYLNFWHERHKKNLKASSVVSNQKIINQIINALGEIPICELRWADVKHWLGDQAITTKTMSNKLSVLRNALQEAFEDELIDNNPLRGKKLRGNISSKKRERIDPFDACERNLILSASQGQLHNIIKFAFCTGLRTSELCALEWSDVDWQRCTITIDKALTQASKVVEDPKTQAGIRDVKLLPQALDALNDQKTHTLLKAQEIFQNPHTQDRWSGDKQYRGQWATILKRARVRYRYPYQTRHTYASMALMAGENIMWVSKQMGHASWAFTASTYSHWIDADAPEAGMKVAMAFKRSKNVVFVKK